MRIRLPHALALAATLASLPASRAFAQQDVDLRALDSSGGFPTSASSAPVISSAPQSTQIPASTLPDDVSGMASNQVPQDDGTPNYGKPRKMKAKLYRPNPKTSPPLSPLQSYNSAADQRRRRLQPRNTPPAPPPDQADGVTPPPTVAVIPAPPPPRRAVIEDDPYAPTGVRVGALRLLPFVETSAGYESNPNQVATGGKSSPAGRLDAGVGVTSDFSNHSLTATLRGGYSEYPSNQAASRPDLQGNVVGRIDVTRNDQINLEGRLTLATQTPGSAFLLNPNGAGNSDRPLVQSEGVTLGGTHAFNRLSVGLRTTLDRTSYGDATLSNGSVIRYSQDDSNDYGVVGRASYEVTPAIIPFAEVGVDQRQRDHAADLSGYYRDSTGGFARAGTTFEMSGFLTGTIGAGYLQRHYADPRLQDLKGPSLDAALIYKPTALTSITGRATTTAAETTLTGSSGAISRNFSIEVAHTFFRTFTLTGIATYQPNDYQGVTVKETYTQYTLKGAYSISRDVQLIGTATRQQLKSSIQSNSFTDESFLLGVRLQR